MKVWVLRMGMFFTLLLSITLNNTALAGDPMVSLDGVTGRIHLEPNGATASEVLTALSEQAGFKLIGEIESGSNKLSYPLNGTIEQTIRRIIAQQSVVILYTKDERGDNVISEVRLLGTGTENSKYLTTGKTYTAPAPTPLTERPVRSIEEQQRRELKRQRRDERRKLRGQPPRLGVRVNAAKAAESAAVEEEQ